MSEYDQAVAEVEAIVSNYWDEYHRPILLSRLGELVSEHTKKVAKSYRGSLSKFVEQDMSASIRKLRLPLHGGGLAPRNSTAAFGDSELESRVPPPAKKDGNSLKGPAFLPDVWRAFTSPRDDSHMFVELPSEGQPITHEASSAEGGGPGWLPVESSDLPPVAEGATRPVAADTAEAIERWASKHAVDVRRLHRELPTPPQSSPRPSPATRRDVDANARSLRYLELFLNSLAPAELARITLTGDVILGIIRRTKG